MPYNFVADSFHINFVADLPFCVFELPTLRGDTMINLGSLESAFVTIILQSTVAVPSIGTGILNAKFTFKGTSPTNHFRTDRPMNALKLCR